MPDTGVGSGGQEENVNNTSKENESLGLGDVSLVAKGVLL